jgi:ABC-type antimicrobial peptide transport system permease subunit
LYVRTSAPLNTVGAEIKRRVAAAHPGFGIDIHVFQDQLRDALVRERLLAGLSGFFGILAVLIATIGLYGVIAYIVIWRRKEVGIRIALGSTRTGIVGLFMKEAGVLIGLGLAFGLVGSVLFARAANSLFFGFSAQDPTGYCEAVLVLAVVAALGSYLPARRASGLAPLVALREE